MTLIPPETLRSAVQAGILNEAQAVRLSVHFQTEFTLAVVALLALLWVFT